jgi:hypothetical protein
VSPARHRAPDPSAWLAGCRCPTGPTGKRGQEAFSLVRPGPLPPWPRSTESQRTPAMRHPGASALRPCGIQGPAHSVHAASRDPRRCGPVAPKAKAFWPCGAQGRFYWPCGIQGQMRSGLVGHKDRTGQRQWPANEVASLRTARHLPRSGRDHGSQLRPPGMQGRGRVVPRSRRRHPGWDEDHSRGSRCGPHPSPSRLTAPSARILELLVRCSRCGTPCSVPRARVGGSSGARNRSESAFLSLPLTWGCRCGA